MTARKDLFGYSLAALTEEMLAYGESKYRARQLFSWIYEKNVLDFDSMTDISKSFREVLKRDFVLPLPKIYREQDAKDGTVKLLLELEDGAKVETVLMRYNYGNVACVSSQVGCAFGCAFCASGRLQHGLPILRLGDLEKGTQPHRRRNGGGGPFPQQDLIFFQRTDHPRRRDGDW